MKNQYFGDINDYLKYGLLRCFAEAGLCIGVCWMLTPDDERSDGRKIGYLSNPERWRPHDATLFDALANSIKKGTRHVRHAQMSTLLPNALFFDELVPQSGPSRQAWLSKALAKLRPTDLLFFDPDNGIEVQSKPNGRPGSCKYLYWDEIRRAWSQGSSLLIFQHFPRQNREVYSLRLAGQLRKHVSDSEVILLITSNVVYLLGCQPKHELGVRLALDIVAKKWGSQIRIVAGDQGYTDLKRKLARSALKPL